MIPEEGELVLADLHAAATELDEVSGSPGNTQPKTTAMNETTRTGTNLGNQNAVTGRNAHGDALAVAVEESGPDGEDLGLVLLLEAALGEEDAGSGLGLGLDALDQDAVEEGGQVLDVAEEGLSGLVEFWGWRRR
jgi:hypothetical protein